MLVIMASSTAVIKKNINRLNVNLTQLRKDLTGNTGSADTGNIVFTNALQKVVGNGFNFYGNINLPLANTQVNADAVSTRELVEKVSGGGISLKGNIRVNSANTYGSSLAQFGDAHDEVIISPALNSISRVFSFYTMEPDKAQSIFITSNSLVLSLEMELFLSNISNYPAEDKCNIEIYKGANLNGSPVFTGSLDVSKTQKAIVNFGVGMLFEGGEYTIKFLEYARSFRGTIGALPGQYNIKTDLNGVPSKISYQYTRRIMYGMVITPQYSALAGNLSVRGSIIASDIVPDSYIKGTKIMGNLGVQPAGNVVSTLLQVSGLNQVTTEIFEPSTSYTFFAARSSEHQSIIIAREGAISEIHFGVYALSPGFTIRFKLRRGRGVDGTVIIMKEDIPLPTDPASPVTIQFGAGELNLFAGEYTVQIETQIVTSQIGINEILYPGGNSTYTSTWKELENISFMRIGYTQHTYQGLMVGKEICTIGGDCNINGILRTASLDLTRVNQIKSTATAGNVASLPGNVAGFLPITIGSIAYKIPLFLP